MEMTQAYSKVYGEAIFVFGPLGAVRWLETPTSAFGNRAPKEFVESEAGRQRIRAELRRIEQDKD